MNTLTLNSISTTVRQWTNKVISVAKDINESTAFKLIKTFFLGMALGTLAQIATHTIILMATALSMGLTIEAIIFATITLSTVYSMVKIWEYIFSM